MANNGRIEIRHNFTGETNFVILTWVKTSAPLAEVGREVYPAPHSEDTLLVTELSPVMYLVRAYRSADGVGLDQQINELAVDASSGAIYPITRIEYTVDGDGPYDPASGQGSLRDPRLMDQTYWIEERGTGSLFTDEIVDRPDAGGGFDFANVEKLFYADGRYVAYIIERVDAGGEGSGSGAGGETDGVVLLQGAVLNADDFDRATMNGKLLITDYSSTVGTLNFPALITIPDCRFRFSAHGGAQNYAVWQLNPGDTVNFKNQNLNVIYFEKGSSIEAMIKDNILYLWNYSGNYERRGTVIGDSNSARATTLGNLLLANESTGVLQGADYPGLWQYVQSLPAGAVKNLGSGASQWSYFDITTGEYPNKSFWGIDLGAGTFRVPHLAELTRKFITTGENAGRFQDHAVGPLSLEIREGSGGSSTGPILNSGFSGQDNPGPWITNGLPTAEKYIRSTGTETLVKNFGEIPFIIL